MKFYAKMPYERVKFVWIQDHWDIHLKGLCRVNNQLMMFKVPQSYDGRGGNLPRLEIYKLSWIEKLRWKLRQKSFEICIGYHWTYPYREQGCSFYYKNPRSVWKAVFWMYYLPSVLKQKLRRT